MTKIVNGVELRLTLGCYVDDLFTLYSHDGAGSLYNDFVEALTLRRNVEDECGRHQYGAPLRSWRYERAA
eukprot:87805-Pleurochrysis_carterae.AAC.1